MPEIENCPVCDIAPEFSVPGNNSPIGWTLLGYSIHCPTCGLYVIGPDHGLYCTPEEDAQDKAAAIELWNERARTSVAGKLREEIATLAFAAHMPDDYQYGLASWVQRMYACYVGAYISPRIHDQVEKGILSFPDAPVWKENAHMRTVNARLKKLVRQQHERLTWLDTHDWDALEFERQCLAKRDEYRSALEAALIEIRELRNGIEVIAQLKGEE